MGIEPGEKVCNIWMSQSCESGQSAVQFIYAAPEFASNSITLATSLVATAIRGNFGCPRLRIVFSAAGYPRSPGTDFNADDSHTHNADAFHACRGRFSHPRRPRSAIHA